MHIPNESALLRRERQQPQDRAADAITRFAGSMLFVYLHVGWFMLWVVYNVEAQRSEIRAQLDFETNVLGEVWTEMIAARLGIDVREVHEKVAERMAAAKARQSAAETGGGALTGDPTLDTEYVHSGVLGAPQQHSSGS